MACDNVRSNNKGTWSLRGQLKRSRRTATSLRLHAAMNRHESLRTQWIQAASFVRLYHRPLPSEVALVLEWPFPDVGDPESRFYAFLTSWYTNDKKVSHSNTMPSKFERIEDWTPVKYATMRRNERPPSRRNFRIQPEFRMPTRDNDESHDDKS